MPRENEDVWPVFKYDITFNGTILMLRYYIDDTQQRNLEQRFGTSKILISHPLALALVCSKAVFLLLRLFHCLLLLPLFDGVLCLVLVLQFKGLGCLIDSKDVMVDVDF